MAVARPDSPPFASLQISQVHYDPTDPLSHLFAWLALLPHALCLTYVVLFYSTREIEIALTGAGQAANVILNFGLKRVFKQARPEAIRHLGKGYGMPSNHAQFVSFFATSMCLFLIWRHTPCAPARVRITIRRDSSIVGGVDTDGAALNGEVLTPISRISTAGGEGDEHFEEISPVYKLQMHHPKLTHTILSLCAIALAGTVAYSRVYLSYHTTSQVLVGCAVGTMFAILWFTITEALRRSGLVAWLLEWGIVRRMRIRDLVCEQDLVEIGWRVWEEQRRVRILEDRRKKRK